MPLGAHKAVPIVKTGFLESRETRGSATQRLEEILSFRDGLLKIGRSDQLRPAWSREQERGRVQTCKIRSVRLGAELLECSEERFHRRRHRVSSFGAAIHPREFL